MSYSLALIIDVGVRIHSPSESPALASPILMGSNSTSAGSKPYRKDSDTNIRG
ncbi:uncharacterized protein G2W53_005408 [Senna tora]|uniref:Uncharacterized protein n=1 Tax=Senna tora TaxID=362788 RepID=A0A835CCS8_9FABA|nr:uncharacterized protein G2W53_005408 [Senna tora]